MAVMHSTSEADGATRSGEEAPASAPWGTGAPGPETAVRLEAHGIDHIPEGERHGKARSLFSVWAAPNVSYLSLVVGAALVLMGLSLEQALWVIVVGNLFWAFTAFISISGPSAGTTGSVISRAMYGIRGNKVVLVVTGWLIAAAYLALNWSAASVAGIGLAGRFGLEVSPLVSSTVIVVIAAATIALAVYGHGAILRLYGPLSILLTLVFIVVSAFILGRADWSYQPPEALEGASLWAALAGGFAIVASAPLSYSNSPDLARYLPSRTRASAVAGWTFLGAFLPSVVFTAVGAVAATSLDMSDPEKALEGIMPGWFVPVFVVAVVLNTVSNNGLTAYSAGLTLQSIGLRISRVWAVLVIGVLGTAMTLYSILVFDFLTSVSTMLELVTVLTGPAMAVFVMDIVMRRNHYDGKQLLDQDRGGPFWYDAGFNWAGISAMVLGGLAAALFVGTTFWTGPGADAVGGLSLSIPAGMTVAAFVYWLVGRSPRAGLFRGNPA
ncbi:cytosine permease [Arthrobacter sp. RCC_34]|uniref:purine-cytosine permease family protein n=1 Tax=Arthrobacter sp. RCC_34 TaxID=3239230 RepID=UPI00352540DC